MRTLTAQRLTLEPLTAVHADEMFPVLCDPAIYEFENEPPSSVEELRERFARWESRRSPDGQEQWLNWVVRLTTGEPAGFVQATVYADNSAFIAFVLGSSHWGQGLAAEAARAMMEELRQEYGVRTLFAVLKSANHRSRRLLERLNFIQESQQLHRHGNIDPGELLMIYHIL